MSIYKVGILLLAVLFFVTGCSAGKGSELEILKGRVETTEISLNSYIVKLDTLETNMYSMDQRLKTLETSYGELAAKKEASSAGAASLSTEELQTALKNAGFYAGAVDGKLGPNTERAIKDFQQSNGLTADGVVGTKTRGLLIKYLKQ